MKLLIWVGLPVRLLLWVVYMIITTLAMIAFVVLNPPNIEVMSTEYKGAWRWLWTGTTRIPRRVETAPGTK